jgi:NAD(P)-dependent dehydrogenase (short-subunit alcohol dehydrogenase family)
VKGTLSTIQLDVTDDKLIESTARYVEEKFGRLDVLINNAGVSSRAPELEKQLNTTLAVNLIGTAKVTEALQYLLLKSDKAYLLYVSSRYGSISCVSDPNSQIHNTPLPIYSVSKVALNMLMVEQARRLGLEGLKVFSVCPGFVRSKIRGEGEENITGHGRAGDPLVSGRFMLDIIEGRRDDDVGRCIHKDGIYPW